MNVTNTVVEKEEIGFEESVRPQVFEQFIGQNHIKESLSLYVKAARKREEVLDHILFYGAPGLGKTTLAMVTANEMGTKCHITSGAIIQKAADLIATLMTLETGDVLFIDEIHRLPKAVEEFLYPAMEDFAIDIITDEKQRRTTRIPLNKFTLIGATTRAGMISAPLRDRFGIDYHLEFYEVRDLGYIASRTAKILGAEIDKSATDFIAKGSRGTPRIVNRIVRRAKDVTDVEGDGKISLETAQKTFRMLRLDECGLNELDRKILKALIEYHNGGPVGISSLAVTVGEDAETVESMHEPYLIQNGFMERTSRGRKATEYAYKKLGYKIEN